MGFTLTRYENTGYREAIWRAYRCEGGEPETVYIGHDPKLAKPKIERYLARRKEPDTYIFADKKYPTPKLASIVRVLKRLRKQGFAEDIQIVIFGKLEFIGSIENALATYGWELEQTKKGRML